jgi:hypothetical protein
MHATTSNEFHERLDLLGYREGLASCGVRGTSTSSNNILMLNEIEIRGS